MTLIEVLISAMILGLGVMGLAKAFFFAEGGVNTTRNFEAAQQLARQRIERLGTLPVDQLPACATVGSCRATQTAFAAMKPVAGGYPCSELVDGMTVADPVGGAAAGTYRIDTVVAAPVDPTQQLGALTVTVSVCWVENGNKVRMAQSERMFLPEM